MIEVLDGSVSNTGPEDEIPKISRSKKWNADKDEVMATLRLNELPDQRMREDRDWNRYAERLAGGDESAREELLSHLLRSMWARAKFYATELGSSGMFVDDYFQRAAEAAWKAIINYDSNKLNSQISLSGSVTSAVSKALEDVDRNGVVKLPKKTNEMLRIADRTRKKLAVRIGAMSLDDISLEMVSAELKLDPQSADKLARHLETGRITAYNNLLPLTEAHDFPDSDPWRDDPFGIVATWLEADALRLAMEELSERERMVLELRYGFNGQAPQSFDEVGKRLNLSRLQARCIEIRALKKLQQFAQSQRVLDL